MTAAAAAAPGRAARLLPILGWLPRYDRRWLRGDIAAGVAVTALVVPKNLGYAGIAGIPLQNGLYAAAAGALIYAVFCTSRQISTGPSSSLAAVAGGAVIVTGLAGEEAAQLVAAIALLTGLLFLALAVLRMGWIAQFLSKAVVTGFLAGAAIDVVIGELPKLTGTSADEATRVVGARRVGPDARRHRLGDGAGGRRRPRRDPGPAVPGSRRPRRAGAAGGRAAWRRPPWTWGRTGSRWSGTSRGDSRRPTSPTSAWWGTTSGWWSRRRRHCC